jgi:hypothetical protein
VGKILHHFVPLSSERLLKQHINRIFYSIVFIFFCDGGFLGREGVILLKREKLKTQLSILKPRWGHALKIDQEQPALIPLIQIIFVGLLRGGVNQ